MVIIMLLSENIENMSTKFSCIFHVLIVLNVEVCGSVKANKIILAYKVKAW